MSDDIKDGELPVEEPEVEDQTEGQEESQKESQEEAEPSGEWMGRDAWEKSGKDPDDWISKKKFDEQGQIIGDIKKLQADNRLLIQGKDEFNQRLEHQRIFMEAQNQQSIESLKVQRKSAIEEADVDGADRIQGQIDTLSGQDLSPPPKQELDKNGFTQDENEKIDAFNTANPWVLKDSPKSTDAARS